MADLRTDHSVDIQNLRDAAKTPALDDDYRLQLEVAADLLELHDRTGISLDNWTAARAFVENLINHPIEENGV